MINALPFNKYKNIRRYRHFKRLVSKQFNKKNERTIKTRSLSYKSKFWTDSGMCINGVYMEMYNSNG